MEPCDGEMEPCDGGMEPCDGGMEPCDGGTEPCDGAMEPCDRDIEVCDEGTLVCGIDGGQVSSESATLITSSDRGWRSPDCSSSSWPLCCVDKLAVDPKGLDAA